MEFLSNQVFIYGTLIVGLLSIIYVLTIADSTAMVGLILSLSIVIISLSGISRADELSGFETSKSLYTRCKEGSYIHKAYCHGYIAGISDRAGRQPAFCIDGRITIAEIASVYYAHAERYPNRNKQLGSDEVALSLYIRYGCDPEARAKMKANMEKTL